MADTDATSVSPPKDDVVTITVNIDAPGIEKKEAKVWKKEAEDVWNAGFDQWPAQCYKLNLKVNITIPKEPPSAEHIEPRQGHHLILKAEFKESHGTLTSGVRGLAAGEDSLEPLQKPIYGAWGDDLADAQNNAYAHEVGHLLGLCDDYINHPATATTARWTEPKPGRQNTLMADGGPVDKALVDRLTKLLRNAGKLPSCWNGKVRSESTQDSRHGSGFVICTEVWDLEVSLRAGPDGAVTGKAIGNFVAQQNCKSYPAQSDFSHHSLYAVFNVQGRFDQKQFELQFFETNDERAQADALRGMYGWNGLLNHTLFIGAHPGPQPTIMVPVVAPDRAEGSTTINRLLSTGANATGIHVVHLTREDFAAKAAVG